MDKPIFTKEEFIIYIQFHLLEIMGLTTIALFVIMVISYAKETTEARKIGK